MIIFHIATVERRKDMFLQVLKNLVDQSVKCDHINVSLSYRHMPSDLLRFLKDNFKSYRGKWNGANIPCEYKLFGIDKAPQDSINLTFDDDIIYPVDYTERMIEGLERNGKHCVVGFHGIKFDGFPVLKYKEQKTMYQYFKYVPEDIRVDVIGTGCMCFYKGTLLDKRFTFADINGKKNCLDGSFGRWCRDNNIPMVVLKHEGDWMKIYPESQDSQSLWIKSSREKYKTKLSFLEK